VLAAWLYWFLHGRCFLWCHLLAFACFCVHYLIIPPSTLIYPAPPDAPARQRCSPLDNNALPRWCHQYKGAIKRGGPIDTGGIIKKGSVVNRGGAVERGGVVKMDSAVKTGGVIERGGVVVNDLSTLLRCRLGLGFWLDVRN
jgi:hypothetical protein